MKLKLSPGRQTAVVIGQCSPCYYGDKHQESFCRQCKERECSDDITQDKETLALSPRRCVMPAAFSDGSITEVEGKHLESAFYASSSLREDMLHGSQRFINDLFTLRCKLYMEELSAGVCTVKMYYRSF